MVMLRTIKLKILILSANITLMASCYQAFHQYFFKKNLDSEHIFFFFAKRKQGLFWLIVWLLARKYIIVGTHSRGKHLLH